MKYKYLSTYKTILMNNINELEIAPNSNYINILIFIYKYLKDILFKKNEE